MKLILLVIGLGCLRSVAWGADVPPITLPPTKSTVFNISSSTLLWYLNGQAPANYNNQIVITAAGPTAGTFVWTPVSNPSAIQKITQGNNQLAIGSLGPSQSQGDVGIALNYNGLDAGIFNLTVYAPASAQPIGDIQNIDDGTFFNPNSGYLSIQVYQTRDQFGSPIPFPMPEHESFGSPDNSPYPTNNWSSNLNPPTSWTTTMSPGPSYFQDKWGASGDGPAPDGWVPKPSTAGVTGQKVFTIPQTYSAGSLVQGSGLVFNNHTVHYFVDHALPVK